MEPMAASLEAREENSTDGPFVREVTGQVGVPGEGPWIRITLEVADDTIEKARFETYGCPYMLACADWLVGWAKGKRLKTVGRIEPKDLVLVVGGLPLGKEHCASLPIQALQNGLKQIETITKEKTS